MNHFWGFPWARAIARLTLIGALAGVAWAAPPAAEAKAGKPKLSPALRKALDKEIAKYLRLHGRQLRLPTGPAGGALNGTFPNPALDVGGGDNGATACRAGEALTSLSRSAAITCAGFGSITAVGSGVGLSGGADSGSVTLSLATSYRLPQGCSAGQLAAWTGASWGCRDAPPPAWLLSGNAGTDPATDYLGTSDNEPLNLDANGLRALQLQPGSDASFPESPNLIGGFSGNNVASGISGATIDGGGSSVSGFANRVTSDFGTIGGGEQNTAADHAAVLGGAQNAASGPYSTASGQSNVSSGSRSTALGESNQATASDSLAAGRNNRANGASSVALGDSNLVQSSGSFAIGQNAGAPSDAGNSFVWNDGSVGPGVDFLATGADQFDALAVGGFNMQLSQPGSMYAGCKLTTSAGWACSSDRNIKRGFAPLSDRKLLSALLKLRIETWSYRLDPAGTRHIGPTAQDFESAFHVGNSPKMISMLDEGGVALATTKGLYQLVIQQQEQERRQQAQITALQNEVRRLEQHS